MKQRKSLVARSTTAALLTLALAGCTLAPTYERPPAPIPNHWQGAGTAPVNTQAAAAELDWNAFVTDDHLRRLIELALDNNRDLRQSLLNVEAARAQYRVQRADRLPSVGVQGSGTRQRVPADLTYSGQSEVQASWQAGVGMTAFELDLFGRVRSLSQAALEEYLATEENARAARISLIAEVIQAYVSRDGAQRRHVLTAQTLHSREAALQLIAQRRQAGTATALDYQEAVGLVQQAKAQLERTDREVRQASNALGLLVGVADTGSHLPQEPATRTLLVQGIAAGAPSDLLTNRPDIQAAEHLLRSRNASIGAARAAFFPSVSLTGLFGSSSAELSGLFEGGQRSWSFTPQITLPIFNAGRNQANLELATVRKDSAIAGYEKAIQTAFKETSDALVAADTLRREEQALRELAQSSQQALVLSQARYRAGVDDHLRYLDAQRNDFANQISLIEVSTQRQSSLTDLFKSLGGRWKAAPENQAALSNGSGI